jgi:hypothetical protein
MIMNTAGQPPLEILLIGLFLYQEHEHGVLTIHVC